jgi:hypothetical protein
MNETIRDWLKQTLDSEAVLWDDCDAAIVGIVERCGEPPVAAYDYELLVEVFIALGMSEDEARDHVDINIIGHYVGEFTPVVLHCAPGARTLLTVVGSRDSR